MKVTELKENKVYKRKSDDKYFKLINKNYLTFENKEWVETEDIKLSDEFEIVHEDPSIQSFEHMFRAYQGGDIEQKQRMFDRMLLSICQELDRNK